MAGTDGRHTHHTHHTHTPHTHTLPASGISTAFPCTSLPIVTVGTCAAAVDGTRRMPTTTIDTSRIGTDSLTFLIH